MTADRRTGCGVGLPTGTQPSASSRRTLLVILTSGWTGPSGLPGGPYRVVAVAGHPRGVGVRFADVDAARAVEKAHGLPVGESDEDVSAARV